MKYGLQEDTIQRIKKVFSSFPEVEKVVLYGSRAKGNFKAGSDIDLVISGSKLNIELLNKINLELDELYLPYTFDLAIYHHIKNQDLLEHIARVGIAL